ncbi:MAG: sugar transferase [Cyclobacteriaceae bacterium]
MTNGKKHYIDIVKPLFDWGLALVLFVFLMPLFIIIPLFNFFHGIPVLFVHKRPGINGEVFSMYKFCTINPFDKTINSYGNFLRKTSLDELPQLFNILKLEMSFIGPRPLLIEYLEIYTNEQKKRHQVRPGISGLAQVNGRNSLSFEEKIEWDLKYVEEVSFWIDLKIIFNTVKQMFRFEEADGHVSMKKVVVDSNV